MKPSKKGLLSLLLAGLLCLLPACGGTDGAADAGQDAPAASQPVPEPEPEPLPEVVATLSVCGDAMSHMPQTRDAWDAEANAYDYRPMIRFVKPWIEQADYALVNLETTFAGGPDYSGFPAFNTPDALGEALKDAGFDLISTANNHCMDRGYDGLSRTLDVLDGLGLAHVGTYRSAEERAAQNGIVLADVGGIQVAFLSYTYGTNGIPVREGNEGTVNLYTTDYMTEGATIDTALLEADLAAAEAMNPDLIAVVMHWGIEYQRTPSEAQREAAEFLIAHGADMVLGSHPHVLEPLEWVETTRADGTTARGFVCWSLGNFISSQNDEYTDTTIVLNLELTHDPNTDTTEISRVSYVPLLMLDREEEVNGERYTLLDAKEAAMEYESGDDSYITSRTYDKVIKCMADCREILGEEWSMEGAIDDATAAETGEDAA